MEVHVVSICSSEISTADGLRDSDKFGCDRRGKTHASSSIHRYFESSLEMCRCRNEIEICPCCLWSRIGVAEQPFFFFFFYRFGYQQKIHLQRLFNFTSSSLDNPRSERRRWENNKSGLRKKQMQKHHQYLRISSSINGWPIHCAELNITWMRSGIKIKNG